MFVYVLFAFFSGITALVYQVVWTRQVALFLGSQIEAISIVLVSFFGGLAIGARYFGVYADRAHAPLRLFGGLEMIGGALAIISPFILHGLGGMPAAALSPDGRLLLAGLILFPIPFLLGGTAPALTRCAVREIARTAAGAGWIVGANTGGAVVGVAIAVLAIPTQGLRATILAAGCAAIVIGAIAFAVARPIKRPERTRKASLPIPAIPLLGALIAGVATLAFEVLAARAASLILGSTLYAWGCVLAILLAGLAAGTALFGGRAGRIGNPARDLGFIESAAGLTIAAGLSWIVPDYTSPSSGVAPGTVALILLAVFPPAFLMGAAFPYFVRLGVRSFESLGKAFGTVSAVNTGGGILGALLAPFLFLPVLGLRESLFLCACLNGLLGTFFLVRGSERPRQGWIRAAVATLVIVLAAAPAFRPSPATPGQRLIHFDDGRQASVAVIRSAGGRVLIVDGDPEAGTTREALETEVLLALLPLVLHPDARDFLEVGLGSGITLGTAARFPLRQVDCVEIVSSVIGAGRFFEPENGGVTRGEDPRVRIFHDDGRAYLARHRKAYDIIVANTLHPWSVGATGLYSREYFGRVRAALRPGGIAVQWVPIARITRRQLEAILRTYFTVFDEGGVWWGAENLLLVGWKAREGSFPPLSRIREVPPDLWRTAGLDDARELAQHRIATADTARALLGHGEILTDDVPSLETRGARGRDLRPTEEILSLLEELAQAGAGEIAEVELMAVWISARLARARGLEETANRLEARAEAAGLALAKRRRVARTAEGAVKDLREGRRAAGEKALRSVLAEMPAHREARYILASIAMERNDPGSARKELRTLLGDHPGYAQGWIALGALDWQAGDRAGARAAFRHATDADPYYPEALANAGLIAAEMGDYDTTREMLARLRVISPGGRTPEEGALIRVLGER